MLFILEGHYGVVEEAIQEGYPPHLPEAFCNAPEDQKGGGFYETPTTCYEAKDPVLRERTADSLQTTILFAEGIIKIHNLTYPKEIHSLSKAFMNYDEPLFPIPVGVSVFFVIMIAWVITFYFTYLGRKILHRFIAKLDLYPEAMRFPDIPLYWLQQTKKEADLRREVRNTWAWLAKRYLLSPNDPLLENVDQVLGQMNWHDFEISRNTNSLITCILKVNALFLKVRRTDDGKEFEIIRDMDLTKIPMEGDQVKRIFEVDDRSPEVKALQDEIHHKEEEPIIEANVEHVSEVKKVGSKKKPVKTKKKTTIQQPQSQARISNKMKLRRQSMAISKRKRNRHSDEPLIDENREDTYTPLDDMIEIFKGHNPSAENRLGVHDLNPPATERHASFSLPEETTTPTQTEPTTAKVGKHPALDLPNEQEGPKSKKRKSEGVQEEENSSSGDSSY